MTSGISFFPQETKRNAVMAENARIVNLFCLNIAFINPNTSLLPFSAEKGFVLKDFLNICNLWKEGDYSGKENCFHSGSLSKNNHFL